MLMESNVSLGCVSGRAGRGKRVERERKESVHAQIFVYMKIYLYKQLCPLDSRT